SCIGAEAAAPCACARLGRLGRSARGVHAAPDILANHRMAKVDQREALEALPGAPIHRGDLFWLPPDDARGPAPSYSHPHVVVQDDVFNHSRITTVIVCALTSNLHRANEPGNVLLEPGEGNLPKQSVVVVSQISS